MANQQKHALGRRFFKVFEQRIGRRSFEIVDCIDDYGPPVRHGWCGRKKRLNTADLIHRYVARQFIGFAVPWKPLEAAQIGMAASGNELRCRMIVGNR